MKSHVLFKALVLGSVFSASLSYSALTLTGHDFKDVKLEDMYSQAPQSVQAKLKSKDLDQGLIAAKMIDQLTSDQEATTSTAYLEQVLKVLMAQDSGDVEGQDGETLTGFGNQIDKLLVFLQGASRIQQMLDKPENPLSTDQVQQLQFVLQGMGENIDFFLAARKDMARVFWSRRVGFNPKHKDAFENAWDALLRYKKIDLIVSTLADLSKDSHIRNIFGITPETTPESFKLSMSMLQNLPAHLLMGITEFSEDLFGPETIQSLIQKYPDLKNILQFRTEGKAFTSGEIALLKQMYSMLKSIPEFAEKKFTFAQILALRDKYAVPYQTYWTGDNEDFSLPGAKIKRGAPKALDALGLKVAADQIRYEKMSLVLRQYFSFLIQKRGLDSAPEGIDPKIKSLLEKAKRLWVQHHLGKKSLAEGESFPEQEKFSALLHALQTQAHIQYVLAEDIPFNFEDIFTPYREIYDAAAQGVKEAFTKVCDWTELVDDKGPLFEEGDHVFYDGYDGASANPDQQNRFARILRGIWTKLARQKLEEHGLDKDAVLVHQKSLETRLRECDPSKLDEEKSGHPGHWIAEKLKIPTGEVIQGLLQDNLDQMSRVERIWFETRGQHITYLPPEELAPGIPEYDAALEALKNPETLSPDENLKLNQTVSGTQPITSVLKVAEQQSALVRIHAFMGEVEQIVRAVENHVKETKEDPAEVFMNTIAKNYPHLLKNLADMVTSRVELNQKLGSSYPQLLRQIDRLNSIWEKYLSLSKDPLIAKNQYAEIYQEFKKLSIYAQRRDMRKSSDLFRQWFDRKSSRAEGYDHILMLRQFISVAQNESLERGIRETLLKKIWLSNTYHPNFEDYLK